MTAFNKTEQEAIILNAILVMIDDMVNYQMFMKDHGTEDAVLMFTTSTHQRMFNILLGDFLSQPQRRGKDPLPFGLPSPPSGSRPSDLTYLFYLRRITDDPKLGASADMVRQPLEAFSDWLEEEALVKNVWLPAIDTELDIRVQRVSFLKICGDIAKHNFSRLEVNVKRICDILSYNGCEIQPAQGYMVLSEFYEWFHENLFNYHSSSVAEFLNNLRWGVYEYLQSEFRRALDRHGPYPMYRFRYPAEVANPLSQMMYWDLMNMVRTPPFFPRFSVTEYLKKRY